MGYLVNTDKNDKNLGNERNSSPDKDKRKPTIDYKVKIRILEKDLNHTYQQYNNTQAKNEQLKKQLNELRQKTQINNEKVKAITEDLSMQEQEFKIQKEEIERKLKTREDKDLLNKINNGQKILRENNTELINQIKTSDKDMTQKLAMKKYFEHERKKLEEKEKKIIQKWKNERKKFYEDNAEEIKKFKSFDPSSKVLDILNEDKITHYQDMLSKIYEQTHFNNITSLVEYFIKCTKEFKNFEDFISNVTIKVQDLEKEVDELEFIINFCEQNLEVKTDNPIDEEEDQIYEEIKKAGEQFFFLEYFVILEQYKKYSEEVMNNICLLRPDWKELENEKSNFVEFIKKNIEKVQICLTELHSAMKSRNKSRKFEQNNINEGDGDIVDFAEVDNKFGQKTEKIKESVKKEFEKPPEKGARVMNINKMRGIVEQFINPENISKKHNK